MNNQSNEIELMPVVIRCRPFNNREKSMGCSNIMSMNTANSDCTIRNPDLLDDSIGKTFNFFKVYPQESTTETVFFETSQPLIRNLLDGYNCSIVAYGSTGSGKTFTMQGPDNIESHRGIIQRSLGEMFLQNERVKGTFSMSYFEIYNEQINDLLVSKPVSTKKDQLQLKESPKDGIYVANLSWHPANDLQKCQTLLHTGMQRRQTGATLMNCESSRSHSVFCVEFTKAPTDGGKRKSKILFVDMAGSERQSKTGAFGMQLMEARQINFSLTGFANVIRAVAEGRKPVPYRDSKLTRLLQEFLGGTGKTLLIACISPAATDYEEALATLRTMNLAAKIKNYPKIRQSSESNLAEAKADINNQQMLLLEEERKKTQEMSKNLEIEAAKNLRIAEKLAQEENKRREAEKRLLDAEKLHQETVKKYEMQLSDLKTLYKEELLKIENLKNAANSSKTCTIL